MNTVLHTVGGVTRLRVSRTLVVGALSRRLECHSRFVWSKETLPLNLKRRNAEEMNRGRNRQKMSWSGKLTHNDNGLEGFLSTTNIWSFSSLKQLLAHWGPKDKTIFKIAVLLNRESIAVFFVKACIVKSSIQIKIVWHLYFRIPDVDWLCQRRRCLLLWAGCIQRSILCRDAFVGRWSWYKEVIKQRIVSR